ncbi:hypothetical protein BOTBODRAFT_240034 [Botryobasidium botryosum FD-172 SS1]|uniref:Uncharacterized protein n=1 Tax=Botryobasidium botryosum (strain FD-172 SS1) TaxID=930990 RepID=A0A067MZ17_BOTB1|nr:hypothetical protein BOTBODRAFT_240034 [Botryobasidium botryosum FD-172 SS1]
MQGLLRVLGVALLLKQRRPERLVFISPTPFESIHPSTPSPPVLAIPCVVTAQVSRYIFSCLVPPSVRVEFTAAPYSDLRVSDYPPLRDHIEGHLPTSSSTFALRVALFTHGSERSARGYTCGNEELFKFQLGAAPETRSIPASLGAVLPTPSLQPISLCDTKLDTPAIAAALPDFLAHHSGITRLAFENCHESVMQSLLDTSICPRLNYDRSGSKDAPRVRRV